jgi:hypothetical protein
MQKTETRSLSHCAKINSKWIKDRNVTSTQNFKAARGKHREPHEDTSLGKDFLKGTPIAQDIITRIDKWDCRAKEPVT